MPTILIDSFERYQYYIMADHLISLPPNSEVIVTQNFGSPWIKYDHIQRVLVAVRDCNYFPRNMTIHIRHFIFEADMMQLLVSVLSRFQSFGLKLSITLSLNGLQELMHRQLHAGIYRMSSTLEMSMNRLIYDINDADRLMTTLEKADEYSPLLSVNVDTHSQNVAEAILERVRRMPEQKKRCFQHIRTNRPKVDSTISQLLREAKRFAVPVELHERAFELHLLEWHKNDLFQMENMFTAFLKGEISFYRSASKYFDALSQRLAHMALPNGLYIHFSNESGEFDATAIKKILNIVKGRKWPENTTLDFTEKIKEDTAALLIAETTSERCTPGFALRIACRKSGEQQTPLIADAWQAPRIARMFTDALKSGRLPENSIVNLASTPIGLEGVHSLLDALSGACPRGLVLIFNYQWIDHYFSPDLRNTHSFMDLLENALARTNCSQDLTIHVHHLTMECANIILTRFKRMPHRILLCLKEFVMRGNGLEISKNAARGKPQHDFFRKIDDINGELNQYIQEVKKYFGIPLPLQSAQPLLNLHAARIPHLMAEEVYERRRLMYAQRLACAVAPLTILEKQARQMYQADEKAASKTLEWQHDGIMLMRRTESLFRNEVTTRARYIESLSDNQPCPVCQRPYDNTDVLRIALIPCHHLFCQVCWEEIKSHSGNSDCLYCSVPVTRFEMTPPLPLPAVPASVTTHLA